MPNVKIFEGRSAMTKYRAKQKLADGMDLHIGKPFGTLEEAKECILADAACGSAKRREVAASKIDDDGLCYAGWDYGIFPEK